MEDSRSHSFNSILDLQESPHKEEARPAFFLDLNINQIIDRICLYWGENVSALYYYLPANAACGDYRREVYGDIKLEGVYAALCAFLDRMKDRKEAFVKKEEVSRKLQKAVWHIREVNEYCRAFGELYDRLGKVPFCSRGMCAFRDYLRQYLEGEAFRQMRLEAEGLLHELGTFRLVLTYENDRIAVSQGQVEGAYDAFLDKFFPGQKKRMKSPFETSPELLEMEQELLKVFQRKNPDFFRKTEEFYEKYLIYALDPLIRFASEIRFYLAFYCFEDKMKEKGFGFCIPDMKKREPAAEDRRAVGEQRAGDNCGKHKAEMYAAGLYDLALACANDQGQKEIVSNDMEFRPEESFFVLTGPNQGGKTTFARSLGQMIYLAQMGLDVPADSAGIYYFSHIMTHFSVEESVETGRGKLMDELIRLVPMMKTGCEDSFVIINELFTTAANYDACIMGKRVLEHFLERGCMGIYVTHLAELSQAHPGVVSLRAMLDGQGVRSFKIQRSEAADYANAASQVNKYGLTYEQLKNRLNNKEGFRC